MPYQDRITPQQQAFCAEYIQNGYNGTQAAIAVGYSEKTAGVQASRLLAKDKIRDHIQELYSKNVMSAQETLSILTDIARGKIEGSDVNNQLTALKEIAKFHNLTNNNTVRIEDWKTDAIALIQSNDITFDALQETCIELGEPASLAEQLFKQAGVEIS